MYVHSPQQTVVTSMKATSTASSLHTYIHSELCHLASALPLCMLSTTSGFGGGFTGGTTSAMRSMTGPLKLAMCLSVSDSPQWGGGGNHKYSIYLKMKPDCMPGKYLTIIHTRPHRISRRIAYVTSDSPRLPHWRSRIGEGAHDGC